jgi:hypothetical protein
MQTYHPFLKNPEIKINIFPHICVPIIYTTRIYTGCSTTTHVHQDLCQKIKKWSYFSMPQQQFSGPCPSIYWKLSNSALQFHFESYKRTISSYGKKEKAFNFERKVTLEKLLHIESASLCPSSLDIVFNPQALSLLLRESHCLSLLSLPLVED